MTLTRTAFVKKFRTRDHCYVYDCNTNRILLVTEAMYDIVDVYWEQTIEEIVGTLGSRHTVEELQQGYALVKTLSDEHQLLSRNRPDSRVSLPRRDELEVALRRSSPLLTLEVTQSCNMRCRYCAFSGGYAYNRMHGTGQMDIATARVALDFYEALERPDDACYSVSFYGGEPLLRFDLIREVISMTKQMPTMNRQGVRLNLTTNATLLSEEMIRFFAAENLSLLISLDGDRSNHDRNRVLADGRGTFDQVTRSVELLKRLTPPEYYQSYVNFTCVVTPGSNLLELNRFFTSDANLFEGKRIQVGAVAPGNQEFLSSCQVSPTALEDRSVLKGMFEDAYASGAPHDLRFTAALYERGMVAIHKRRLLEGPQQHIGVSPTCLAGGRRLFVACDGSLHICERINNHFPIGDVFSGLDMTRLLDAVHGFAGLMNAPDCLDCWALHFCPHCYATLAADGVFSQQRKDDTCSVRREQVLADLITYCSVLEQNPEAWAPLDLITIS